MTPSVPPQNHSNPGSVESNLVAGGTLKMKPKTKQEIAQEYEVHPNTISTWCKSLGLNSRRKLTIKEVIILYNAQGWPGDYELRMKLS